MLRAKKYDMLQGHRVDTPVTDIENPAMKLLVRLSVYLAFFGVTAAMILYIIHSRDSRLLQDNGIIECSQLIVLSVSIGFFYAARHRTQKFRLLYGALPLLCMMACCREMDYILSSAWIVPVIFLAGIFLYMIFTHFNQFKFEAQEFIQTQQFTFLLIGFFIVCIFAQLSNREDVWRAILGLNYDRKARFFEEILEFFGYGLLMIGAIECYFSEMFKHRIKLPN